MAKDKNALMPGDSVGTGNSILDALASYWQNLNDQARGLPAFQPVQNGQLSPFAQSVAGNMLGFVGGIEAQPMSKVTVYRGGGPGGYYSSDPAFAAEFGPVKSKLVDPTDILDLSNKVHQQQVVEKFGKPVLDRILQGSVPENGLPYAGDAGALDLLDQVVPTLGFKASKQSEGAGMPWSILFHK